MNSVLGLFASLSVLASVNAVSSVTNLAKESIDLINRPVITRKVIFDNQSIDVGDQVFGSLYEPGVGQSVQTYINQGLVAQDWNELDNNDGEVTHISGHNPGVMSNFANRVQAGKTIIVYDAHGNARTYRVNRVMETPMNRAVNGVSADVIDYMYYHMYDHEALLIQFCRPERSIMQIWEAVPV